MIGEASGIVPDRGLNILYRVTLNSLGKLTDDGLTKNNYSSTQQTTNTRLSSSTPRGILAGMVVAAGTVNGTIVACDQTMQPLGVAENNAVGYPFESSSGVGSGKCPYLSGAGSCFATDLYETQSAATGDITAAYTPGALVYSSTNGLLTNASDSVKGSVAIGVVLTGPSTSDPFMVVQMRI